MGITKPERICRRQKELVKKKRHDNPKENVTFTVNDKFDTASLCTILVQGSLFFTYFNNEFSSVYISFKDFKTRSCILRNARKNELKCLKLSGFLKFLPSYPVF